MTEAVLAALVARLGERHVLVAPELKARYEQDWTGRFGGSALAVARPGNTDEVASTVRICAEAGIAIVPQGGNTGLVGGGVPRGGEVVLSLARLDEVEPVDATASEIVVGAGVPLAALQRHAAAAGFGFGVDFAARDSATVGGMIATNAGGVHVLRYGSMRGQILGIEVVLASGQVVQRMSGLRKDNTGYDLAALLAGSEGTLGIITRARLRLVPTAAARVVALLGLEDTAAALAVFARLRHRLPSLEAVELFFDDGLALVTRHAAVLRPFPESWPAYLLIECAAATDPTDELAAVLDTAPEVGAVAVATDSPGRAQLWRLRESHPDAISAEGIPHKFDVTVPLGKLAAFETAVRELVSRVAPAARTVIFGHVGDGNLHVNVLGLERDDQAVDNAVLHQVADFGGSISAEHGIGVAKVAWLPLTRGPADIAAMASIKAALDPAGLLNPGVLLPCDG